MTTTEPREVVKVRLRSHTWTSPAMSAAEAVTLQAATVAAVALIGSASGFIEFTGRDGRPVWIRGREVIVVERNTEHIPAAGYAQGGFVGGSVLSPAADGTEYLRRHHESIAARGRQ